MLFTIVAALATVLAIANAQPAFPASTTLSGRSAEVRFVKFLSVPSNPSATFGAPTTTYGSTSLSPVTAPGGAFTPAALVDSESYQLVDTHGQGSVTIEISLQGVVICTPTVQQNKRNTITVTQNVNDLTSSGVCSVGTDACFDVTGRTVTFSCTSAAETLATRTCDDVDLVLQRRDLPACALRLERTAPSVTGLRTGGALPESALLQKQFTLASESVTLERGSTYQFESSGVAIDTTARAYEAIAGTGSTITLASYTSGYLNVVNAAHRVQGGLLDNVVDVVVKRAGFVVHFVENVAAGSSAGSWVELEADTYQVEVYSGNVNNAATLFDGGVPQGMAVLQTSVTIGDGEFHVVLVKSATTTISSTTSTISTIDVTPNDALNAGDTQFAIYNLVNSFAVRLAAPTSTCCNLLGSGQLTFGDTPLEVTSTELDTDFDGQRTYNVYAGGATCGDLGATFGASVSLADVSTATCAKKLVFLIGRSYTRTVTSSGSCSVCNFVESDIGDLNFIDNVSPTGALTTLSLDLPKCDCVPPPTCTTVVDCGIAAEFAALDTKIDTVASNVASLVNSIPADTTAQLDIIEAQTKANFKKTEAESAAVQRDIKEVLDEVDEVKEEAEDAVDAAEDAVDAAEDAEKAANKFGKKLIGKVNGLRDEHAILDAKLDEIDDDLAVHAAI